MQNRRLLRPQKTIPTSVRDRRGSGTCRAKRLQTPGAQTTLIPWAMLRCKTDEPAPNRRRNRRRHFFPITLFVLPQTNPMKEFFENLLKLQELEFGDLSNADTEAGIAKLRQKIPLPILEHYDRLADRGKKGAAAVRHQVCTGCHMRVPMGDILTLLHDTDIQMCDTCGRYLYLPPEAREELVEVIEEVRTAPGKSKPRHRQDAPAPGPLALQTHRRIAQVAV
jgi:hypothetical protein